MKKLIFASVIAILAAGGAWAYAPITGDLSPYVSGKIGYSHSSAPGQGLDFNGVGLDAAAGVAYRVNPVLTWRQELELSYSPQWGNRDSFYGPLAGMVNTYLDFGNCNVRPYIGAGLGASLANWNWKDANGAEHDYSRGAFNWALSAGLNFDLARNLILDAGLRYSRAEVLHANAAFQTFAGTLGLRYMF
ncbi:MAG: acyloxyacyl hydrolase [Proteobacteria bacterium]|nr:acyloxyacyl hydrolase [Pseudomonadota bacterium]